ncbi:MAG: bifunctional glutamate N-acetyltransferase/amino-acid acetyltransferase ArgJ [Pseudomonadota bacterium]
MAAARAARDSSATIVSPLAPEGGFPSLPPIAGVTLSATAAGVRYTGRDDVMLALLAPGTVLAGVTTKSATRSAPVLDIEAKLAAPAVAESGAAIIVNAGNANAFTGRNGAEAVAKVTAAVANAADVPQARVFSCSTGVIGEPLPEARITQALSELVETQSPQAWEPAARAIMTTDTFPKGAVQRIETTEGPVTLAGFAKGSGMIAPDMATMLVFLFTDARLSQPLLQRLIVEATDQSFNCITVDSDTSTSDTLLMAATGLAGPDLESDTAARALFATGLRALMEDLAHQVVRDGEGATKFVTIEVTGAADSIEAKKAAMAVANSPLVKTAIAGEDPNWGRVVMAVGKSGAQADRDRVTIHFGDIEVARDGWVSPDYAEADGAAYMKQQKINIHVDLGLGEGRARVWTCDLTHAYISINADYRS